MALLIVPLLFAGTSFMGMQNAYADGNVDQESTFDGGAQHIIGANSQRGQVFIPTVDNLIAIDVKLKNDQMVNDIINISIHPGSNASKLLDTDEDRIGTIMSIEGEIKHLHLDSPVALDPGQPFILELVRTGSDIAWGIGGEIYPDGIGVFCNPGCGEDTLNDFFFRTYFQPSLPIGGTVGSMDTISLLVAGAQANMSWWIITLVGAVVGVGIVYKAKTNKTHKETL